MLQNILSGLGGGGAGGLMSLFGPPGGFLGMLNGGGQQPGQQPTGMSGMDLFNGPLASAGQDPMSMLTKSLEPFGLLKMIMKGLQ